MSDTKNSRMHNGTFANGNQFWKRRSKHGRNTAFTPDSLIDSFFKYMQSIEDNEIVLKEETITNQYSVITKTTTGKRPMSKRGFNAFLGKGRQYLQDLKKAKEAKGESEFVSTISYIENGIEAEQLEGVLSNIFNANLISRMLGLKKRANQNIKVK